MGYNPYTQGFRQLIDAITNIKYTTIKDFKISVQYSIEYEHITTNYGFNIPFEKMTFIFPQFS
jgi:hypothetical protein